MYNPRAGTQHYNVALRPPQILEFMTIANRLDAGAGDAGRAVLACEARGFGLFSWCVLVDDLEAVSRRLGIPIDDCTIPHGDGTLRGWRTVSGPDRMPFFIDYPNNGDRKGRLLALAEASRHSCLPGSFLNLVIEGDEGELREWLGPHELPILCVPGDQGVVSVEIATSHGPISLPF